MRIFLPLILLISFFSASLKAQDSFQVYITPDLAVNSSLLAWDEFRSSTFNAICDEKLKLYDTNGERFKGKAAIEKQLSLAAWDEKIKDTLYMPLLQIQFEIRNKALYAFHPNPFSKDTHQIGRLDILKVLKICPEPAASILRGISLHSDFLKEDAVLNDVTVYTYSLMAFDSLQKQLATISGEHKRLRAYDMNFIQISDSMKQGGVTELATVQASDGSYKDKWLQLPEQQLWKGVMAAGHTDRNQVYINHWGLLIHPETKYVGWDPGKRPWFYVSDSELNKRQKEEKKYLDGIFYYAQLHVLDPDVYRCQFYKDNAIKIENSRYPNRH